jgi:putative ABC transport system permease protein
MDGTINKLESAWTSALPQEPFSSFSYREYIKGVYKGERITGETILWFSFLAIFIACLGLLGLANFTYSQKRKEIGIRKVLGAEAGQVARSITFSFLKLVLIAGCIALPLAWWLSERWLESFAFKAYMGPLLFILPIILVAALAWVTIFFQVRRLANTNPSDVLKFE